MKFVFPLTKEGIQLIVEADSFVQAQSEYEKAKEEVNAVKTEIIKVSRIVPQKRGIYEHLVELKEKGFFSEPRTISEIKDKLAELTIHKPLTSFPPYLNSLIRDKILKRIKQNKDGKEVWTYENGDQ